VDKKRLTYTEQLARLSKQIGDIATLVDRQRETNALLRELNGHVRSNSELLAAHEQWIEDHRGVHDSLDGQMHSFRTWLWSLGGGGGLLGLFSALRQFFT